MNIYFQIISIFILFFTKIQPSSSFQSYIHHSIHKIKTLPKKKKNFMNPTNSFTINLMNLLHRILIIASHSR